MPRPSSSRAIRIWPCSCRAVSFSVDSRRLPRRRAPLRRLHPVIDRVPHQVHKGVANLVDHRTIDLGALALHAQVHVLAQAARQVADHPRELAEQHTHRQHPDLHHALVQPVDQLHDVRRRLRQRSNLVVLLVLRLQHPADLRDPRPIERQLAHHVHQRIEPVDVDPHRLQRLDLLRRDVQLIARALAPRLRTEVERAPLLGPHRRARIGLALLPRLDHHIDDVAHRLHGGRDRLGRGIRRDQQLDRVARLLLRDLVLGRRRGHDLAAFPQVLQHLERPHRGPLGLWIDLRTHVQQRLIARGQLLEARLDPGLAHALLQAGAGIRLRVLATRVNLRPQRRDDRLDVDARRVRLVDQLLLERLQPVQAEQQHVDQLRRHRLLALAHAIEQVLHRVRQPGHRVEAEHPGRALERVRRPEDLLQQLDVVRLALEPDDALVEQLGQALGLLEEDLQVVGRNIAHCRH